MFVMHVVGARPNLMKVAPVMAALGCVPDVEQALVHTGQHHDEKMSAVFFEELSIPAPDVNLGVGAGTHAEQTGRIMMALEPHLERRRPDVVVVYGDVNSTVASALVAAKARVPCAHVEAGLRSRDRSMPEEINRVVTDRLCDLLLTPSADADENLRAEGRSDASIVRVGNVMIDTLLAHVDRARTARGGERLGLPRAYALLTMHRPSNVDAPERLAHLVGTFEAVARRVPLVFPVHPRTKQRLEEAALFERLRSAEGVHIVEPLGYVDFVGVMVDARLVLTDSGGIQEETTALGIPCLTLRENTERPVTTTVGSNVLVGRDRRRTLATVDGILAGATGDSAVPELWDGRAAERCAAALVDFCARGTGVNDDGSRGDRRRT